MKAMINTMLYVAILCLAVTAQGAGFMKYDGVDGESRDKSSPKIMQPTVKGSHIPSSKPRPGEAVGLNPQPEPPTRSGKMILKGKKILQN